MTHLRIEIQPAENECGIEMWPPLDEQSVEIVHNLGITGIKRIVERDQHSIESMTYEYECADLNKLNADANVIAEALKAVGTEVTVSEKLPLQPRAVKASRRRGQFALRAKFGHL